MGKWTISEEDRKRLSAFMQDFWSLIKASYVFPDKDADPAGADHYWSTLAKWADALRKKYPDDHITANLIMAYLDTQSGLATGWDVTIETDDSYQ